MDIVWTNNTKITFYELTAYFGEYWQQKQYFNFEMRVLALLENISQNPKMFKGYKNDIRKAILLDKISLFYTVENNINYILHNKQSLNKLKLI